MRRRRLAEVALPLAAVVALAAACQIPVKLPSKGPTFGNVVASLDNTQSCPSYQAVSPCLGNPNAELVWAAINGPYATHANGDPFATKCTTAATGGSSGSPSLCDDPAAPNGATNPRYRSTGSAYAIDVSKEDAAADLPVTLYGYDLASSRRNVSSNPTVTLPNGTVVPTDCQRTVPPFNTNAFSSMTSQHCQTGDNGPQNTDVQVYDNDGTDNGVSYDVPLPDCRVTVLMDDDPTPYRNRWVPICTIEHPRAGVYPLRVRSSGIPGVADAGVDWNAYSLAIDGTTNSRLRALDDVSTWRVNPSSSGFNVLGEIVPGQAGKKLVVDLFDVGDGNGGTTTVQVRAPGAGSGTIVPAAGLATACSYNAVPADDLGPDTPDAASSCQVTTRTSAGVNVYNDRWLRVVVQLDAHYTCGGAASPDCWWKLAYSFTGPLQTDRLTYRVTVV